VAGGPPVGDAPLQELRLGARRRLELALHLVDRVAVEVAQEEAREDVGHHAEEEDDQGDRQHSDQEVREGQPPAHLVEEGAVGLPEQPEQQDDRDAGQEHPAEQGQDGDVQQREDERGEGAGRGGDDPEARAFFHGRPGGVR
jgi:hypothetical protein